MNWSHTATAEALMTLQQQRFDLVISDMGRPSDGRAESTLLKRMQEQKIHVPFLIYAAGVARGRFERKR